MQGTNPLTMQCAYITPCGWCARQNKECDLRIEKKKKVYGDLFKSVLPTNKACQSDEDHQWESCGISTAGSDYRCSVCGAHKTVPIQKSDDITISY